MLSKKYILVTKMRQSSNQCLKIKRKDSVMKPCRNEERYEKAKTYSDIH